MYRGFTPRDGVLGVLLALPVAWYAMARSIEQREAAIRRAAQAQVCELARAVDQYVDDNGAPPATLQGLAALVHRPAIGPVPPRWRRYLDADRVPKDAWGNDYVYQTPGPNGDLFFIFCFGPDRKLGRTDEDEITSIGCGGE